MASSIVHSPRRAPGAKAVGVWLLLVALLIAAMVTLGGLTRLTGSGLSITEWHPVTGVVPPLNEQHWAETFAKYRRIPQYRLENPHMSLADFKQIYWWEWTHRLLGRLLGAAFLFPFLFFAATGAIARADLPRMLGLFALGSLQGFVGWWMVQSGLETRVSVSQYRLAIHLGVAIVLLGAILWTALDYLVGAFPPPRAARLRQGFGGSKHQSVEAAKQRRWREVPRPARRRGELWNWSLVFVALVYAQMLLGALVAGLHAGLVYNTWPSMDGRIFPESPFFAKPWWLNFGENAGLVQFDHRIGAYLVALSALALWIEGRRAGLRGTARLSSNVMLGVTGLQIVAGIVTLLNQAPVALAATHQAIAVALFATALWHAHVLRSVLYAAASP
jgi:cytochrome c oxidase assembly protein subunit 15